MRASSKEITSKIIESSQLLSTNLEDVRGRIDDLKEKRSELKRMPVPKSVAFQRVEDWVRSEVERAKERISSVRQFSVNSSQWHFPFGTFGDAMLVYMAPAIESAIKDDVTKLYADNKTASEEEIAAMISRVERDLLDLELVEESIIRDAERAGIKIIRRVDADPRAVLAHESVLP